MGSDIKLGTGKKIAICDDNDDILEMFSIRLKSDGYRVGTAHGCKELLVLLEHYEPELLILDIRIPEMDGFDVLEKINDLGFKFPVILVTAHDHFMYRNYAPVAGVRDYMTKPIDLDQLASKVAAILC